MKFSVLIAVYKKDNPDFFKEALNSVIDQTLKPDEIVLIEDGELTDIQYEIIHDFVLNNPGLFKIVKNEINIGLGLSLQKGVKESSNEIIARMDSDDISDPLRFERQFNYLQEHPGIDVLGGALQEFNDENSNLNVRHYPLSPEQCREYIVKASPLAHPTVMMRRRIFDEGITYNEQYRTSQDIALWFELLSKGYSIANIPEVTILFRRDDAVFKRRNRSKAINEFKIYMSGIKRLYGVYTFAYLYPMFRLVFRLLPTFVVKWIYGSSIRKRVVEK